MTMALILIIPLVGTIIGSSLVFFLKNKISNRMEKLLLGIASGVMVAASIWSLIIPSIDLSLDLGRYKWLPAVSGFSMGIVLLLGMDDLIAKIYKRYKKENSLDNFKSEVMLIFAVVLHNIPEGMAVGVTLSGLLLHNQIISLSGVLALSLAMAIQNIPEGFIIAMNLKAKGENKREAFFAGLMSGVVEPISALITLLITRLIISILPYILALAAGAMMYVVVEELIPQAQQNKKSRLTIGGFTIGFCLMIILDIIFG